VRAALGAVPGLGRASSRLLSGDDESTLCAYRAGGERLTVEIESGAQPYMAFEAANVHQVQANVSRTGAKANDYPKEVAGVGVVASWIPADRQLITTNATRHGPGAFVRVTMRRRAHGAPADRRVATRVARAALRTAPRGPGG
jgi:hypothetical protein